MSEDILQTSLTRDSALLTDKVAFITGGAAGIGRGIAVNFATFGADVAIMDIDAVEAAKVKALVEAKGRRALVIEGNVLDRDAIRAAVERTVAELGRLDILVNNVGGTRFIDLVDITDKQVDKVIDLNLKNLVATTQAAAKAMIAGGRGGSIINIASIEGLRAAPGNAVYAACKAGMLNFTRTTALELSHHGIRVNAIAPDLIGTAFFQKYIPHLFTEDGLAQQARTIPLGHRGNLDDCAGAAIFLASALSAYVTGVTISVDGGTWASSGWARTRDFEETGRWQNFF